MKKESGSRLREAGLKATPARILIFELLCRNNMPVDAESIRRLAREDVDMVTIYRTLASFEKAGIAKKVDIRKDSVHYELASHHHHHIVCRECGEIEDFEACNADTLSRSVLSRSSKFKAVLEHSFELFGVCNSCVAH